MVAVFAEVRRVLAVDGTCWLNLGDSYSTRQRGSDEGWDKSRLSNPGRVQKMQRAAMRPRDFDRPAKSMLGIPWRVAFGLQDDGWWLRNDIIWAKNNAMPESVTDRLATKHEHVFLLARSARYWFDLEQLLEPLVRGHDPERTSRRDSFARSTKEAVVPGQSTTQHRQDRPDVAAGSALGRNPGDVWTIPTQPFAEAHFATMPVALAERCVLAGCRPGGVVLDPYSGSGTTGLAATRHGRRYVGIDLNADYLDLSLRTRLAQTALIEEPA